MESNITEKSRFLSKTSMSSGRRKTFFLWKWARFILIVWVICFGGSMGLFAFPDVEVTPPKGEPHYAGEKIVFYVKISGEGTFSGVTQFDLPKIENALLMQEDQHPVIDSRTEGEKEIYSQLYTFLLFCQRADTYAIPDFTVRFSLKPTYNATAKPYTEIVKGFSFTTVLPEGANANEQIVSCTDFTLSETWSPKPVHEKTGNAFRRTIKMVAYDLPGMLLPKVEVPQIDGIAVYPKPPLVNDSNERGDLIGTQQLVFDFVCERAGKYEIPAIQVRWWNNAKKEWETASLDAVSFDVTGEAVASGTKEHENGGKAVKGSSFFNWTLGLGGIVASFAICIFLFRRKESDEKKAFKELVSFSRAGNVRKAYNAYFTWLKYFDVKMDSAVIKVIGDDVWNNFQESLSNQTVAWESKLFLKKIYMLRKKLHILKREVSAKEVLPPLNP